MKRKLFEFLKKLIISKYKLLIWIISGLTIIFAGISTQLDIKASWLALVPEHDPVVEEFKSILDNFGNAEGIILVVEGKNEDQIIPVINELADSLKKDKKNIKNVYYKSPRDYIRNHGLMMQKEKDLKDMVDLLSDPNLVPFLASLNDNFEKEYIEPDSGGLIKKERDAVFAVSSIKYFLTDFNRYLETGDRSYITSALNEFLLGPEYFFSRNRDKAILVLIPAISSIDYDKAVVLVNEIDDEVARIVDKYSGVTAGITGMHVIARDEMETGMNDTIVNIIIALVVISVLFILSFRMVSSPLLAMLNLVIGIIWTVGITTIIIGEMDIMTLMITIVLIGLGVDYSIHILSTYSEARVNGKSPEDSVRWSIDKSASGIITGGLTTALAFFALVFTSFKGFRQFGFVMALGIICILATSMVLLPSILLWKDKRKDGKAEKPKKQTGIDLLSNTTEMMLTGIKPYIIVVVIISVSIFLYLQARSIGFDGNLMNLEAKGLRSIELQDVLEDSFDISSDPVFVTSDSLQKTHQLTKKIEDLETVSIIDSITNYVPPEDKQLIRQAYLKRIRSNAENYTESNSIDPMALEDELMRLEDNLYELADMSFLSGLDRLTKYLDNLLGLDKDGKKVGKNLFDHIHNNLEQEKALSFQKGFVPEFKDMIITMSNSEIVTINDLPDYLKSLFISNDGEKFLITFYSSNNLWKEMNSREMEVYREKVSEKVTGVPLFIKVLIELGAREGKKATLISFIAIFLLALIDLRDIRLTLIAIIPLVAGALWMVGIMSLTNHDFNMVNILAVPLIIGIGIDDGIHIIHRYLIEGKGHLKKVTRSTGRAVILTSLTTMMAFGSLITARYRGYASFGTIITYGIFACLVLSIIFLPALLKICFEKFNWNLKTEKKDD